VPDRLALGLSIACFVLAAALMVIVPNVWTLAVACVLFAAFIALGAIAMLRPSRLEAGAEGDS
jgi:hypothetical protein